MVTLRDFEPIMTKFDARKLFDTTKVDFNLPGTQCMESGLLNRNVQAAGRSVFCVAICADRPKNIDPTITIEVNQTS